MRDEITFDEDFMRKLGLLKLIARKVRMLLSRYRSYAPCAACEGARLKAEALDWRLGSRAEADAALDGRDRFRPSGTTLTAKAFSALPGLNVHDVLLLPLDRCNAFFDEMELPKPWDEATSPALT